MSEKDVQKQEHAGEWNIVILQRGWVMVGKLEMQEDICLLHDAAVIRRWGTTRGLPELAERGVLPETILDRCTGIVRFHILTTIAILACNEGNWV